LYGLADEEIKIVKNSFKYMNEEYYLKIKLKENWDFPQNYHLNVKSGIFDDQLGEIKKLKDIFLRKPQSSILVSGPRGKGKTSLIYYIINQLREDHNFATPIVINASQLEIENTENQKSTQSTDKYLKKINCSSVLENIIRRLYASLDDEIESIKTFTIDIRRIKNLLYNFNMKLKLIWFRLKVGRLYKKCLATEWRKSEDKKTVRRFSINIKLFVSGTIISSLGIIYYFFVSVLFEEITQYYVNFYLYISISIVFTLNFLAILERTSSELYSFDKNLSNLEHDFRILFKKVGKIKLIFIIDELDLLTLDEKILDEKKYQNTILPLIKLYKNLFHFIPAVFCFIGDHELYDEVEREDGGVFTTIFTEMFYLSYPKQERLYNYLDKIIDEKSPQYNKDKWGLFKNYLMYKAKGDFKKVNRVIRDYLEFDKNEWPYLIVSKEDVVKEVIIKSKVYNLLKQIYDESIFIRPSETKKNDRLFDDLYEIINIEVWGKQGYKFDYSDCFRDYQETFLRLIEDFVSIEELSSDDKAYLLQGNSSIDIDKIPDSISNLLPHENEAEEAYKKFKKIMEEYKNNLSLGNNYISWLEGKAEVKIKELVTFYSNNLPSQVKIKNIRKIMNRQTAEHMIDELASVNNVLEKKCIELLKKKIIEKVNVSEELFIDKINDKIFELMPSIKDEFWLAEHQMVYLANNFSKQLVIVDSNDNKKVQNWKKEIQKNGLSSNYKIVNRDFNLSEILSWLQNYKQEHLGYKWYLKNGVTQFLKNELIFNKVDGIIRNSSGHLNTFIISENNIPSLIVECEVLLEPNGILNLVIDYQNNKDGNERYYMARLDARMGSDIKSCGSGMLFKSYNPIAWSYVDPRKDKFFEESDEPLKIRLEFKSKFIKFYKYEKKIKGKGLKKVLIDNIKTEDKIEGKFGFFNEKGKVIIKNIVIKS